MAKERSIPTIEATSEFKIFVNETEIPRSATKISVNVMKMVNKISSAIIVLQDGSPADEDFPLSNGELFVPGNKIVISAGGPDQTDDIFNGIIIKQSIKIRSNKAPQLIIECKHKAIRTSIGRKNACFHDMTDSDAFDKILKGYDFRPAEIDIQASTLSHKELVQYNCTDWDFILNRAEMAGKIILTNDEKISIKTPTVTGDAALSLLYGNTIIELDAEMDSRNQYASVKAKAWDMASQVTAESTANEPKDFEEHGNLAASDLAAVMELDEFTLNHSGVLTPQERQVWADAQLLKSRLSKIRGRAKFGGIATINPGDILELNGLGERFNGKAFVSGVRQDYDGTNGWKTQAQFGHSPEWFADENTQSAQKAGGLLPGVIGLHTGIVTDNEDPEGEMRVRVKFPYVNADDDGVWARIALTDAGTNRGFFFRPEIGDEVILGFLYDDPRQPVILGMLHSSALPSPLNPSNDNHLKGYTSREQLKMIFDDEKKELIIETPGGNKVTISDDKKLITLVDLNKNKIEMTESGINMSDGDDSNLMTIKVQPGTINIKAKQKVTVEAPQIALVDGATHPLVFGDSLLKYLNQIVQVYATHTHPGQLALGVLPVTPAPPAPPLPPATPSLLSVKVKTG